MKLYPCISGNPLKLAAPVSTGAHIPEVHVTLSNHKSKSFLSSKYSMFETPIFGFHQHLAEGAKTACKPSPDKHMHLTPV